MVKLNIITPHGGDISELYATAKSISNIEFEIRDVKICWIIVLNNGSILDLNCDFVIEGNECKILDINPVACRSTARNFAIEYLIERKKTDDELVMFLDSGDLIEIGLIASISKYTNQDLIIGAVKVSRGNLITIRKQPDLKLINYINPIYLGSVLVKLKFVRLLRFEVGRKEDWKFWTALLHFKPSILITNDLTYTYTIKTKMNHGIRKISLFRDQWQFFRRYKNYNVIHSILAMVAHYTLNFYYWVSL